MMEFILFFYTLIIMLFAALAAATCLSGFLVSHRKSFAYGMVMFVAYFFDVSIVFYHDFVVHNESLDPAAFYDINSPVMFIICGAAVFGSLWLYFCEKAGMYNPVGEILPTVMFVAMSAAVLIFITEPHLRIFLFFINRSVFLAVIFVFYFYNYFSTSAKNRPQVRPKPIYVQVAILITIGIVSENAIFQLFTNPYDFEKSIAPFWFFAERSIAENMLFIWLAIMLSIDACRTISVHFNKAPLPSTDRSIKNIDNLLPSYCAKYNLSAREGEILRMILMGSDNSQMASSMHLALSTVKKHVHNIIAKVNVDNKNDIIRDFWRS